MPAILDGAVPNFSEEFLLRILRRERYSSLEDHDIDGFKGRQILITGGCGTIGRALAERLAEMGAQRVTLLDSSESAVVESTQYFHSPAMVDRSIDIRLGRAGDGQSLERILESGRYDFVFHAAAYKHLNILEDNSSAAVSNNVLSAWSAMQSAGDNGVACFVLVSTDKACYPTSILGASKRLAEKLLLSSATHVAPMKVVALRLPNILGSSGSVLECFSRQVLARGPLLVSDEQAERFFLVASEAADFLLAVVRDADSGSLFAANAGEVIMIKELAKRFIAESGCSGLNLGIEFTSLRAGEKLKEQLVESPTACTEVRDRLLKTSDSVPADFDRNRCLDSLVGLYGGGEESQIQRLFAEYVPEYRSSTADHEECPPTPAFGG